MRLPESPWPPTPGMYKQYPLSFPAPLWLLGSCLLSQSQLSCSLSGKHFPAWSGFPTALCRCFHGSAQSLIASFISCGLGCFMLPLPWWDINSENELSGPISVVHDNDPGALLNASREACPRAVICWKHAHKYYKKTKERKFLRLTWGGSPPLNQNCDS